MEFETKYLIIGGGIAGTACAETLRKEDKNARIIIVSDEPHRLYSRVLLTKPNFFHGKIPFDRIFLKDDKWYQDQKIELWLGRKAVHLDPVEHKITLDNTEVLKYEKLLLAVGGAPRRLDIPGADKKGIYYLRTIDETKEIIEAVKHAKKGVSLGGGIIGFEMAEMMVLGGLDTTFVLASKHYRDNVMGIETAIAIEKSMEEHGVKIKPEAKAVEILGDDHITGIRFADGSELECDFLVVGIGTVVPADFITEAGIVVDQGIKATAKLKTNKPDTYTAGDCAQFYDPLVDEEIVHGSWANAQAQGQTAARNMMGHNEQYRYVSFFTTHGFGHAMTYVGDTRQNLPGREIIERGTPGDKGYGRIVIEDNQLTGALFLDSTTDVQVIGKLIEKDVIIRDKKAVLADPDSDLNALLPT
ncbi:MAG: NAD(P)/FAD-dependent oxidoreductase [Candidatus Pacebacteria bacterium]|jgi:NAD(P)H-nitrite reductase large subunit|nr:NAD(P)/FAD-dependent oxidoreductase [Candidatus Paceibacterota bacterium]